MQYGAQRGQAVAQRQVNTRPIKQIGQAGLFSRGQTAQRDGTAALRVVRALADQVVSLLNDKKNG